MNTPTRLMLSTLFVAVAGALTSLPAHADGHHSEQLNAQFTPSTRTRAEVRAELLAALRDGSLVFSEYGSARSRPQAFTSTRSRAEVAAEAREANRKGAMQPSIGAGDLIAGSGR